MGNSNKIKSINKQLNTIFKDLKSLPIDDVNKVLFNIELFKNKYLKRTKQSNLSLYEMNKGITIKGIIKNIKLQS